MHGRLLFLLRARLAESINAPTLAMVLHSACSMYVLPPEPRAVDPNTDYESFCRGMHTVHMAADYAFNEATRHLICYQFDVCNIGCVFWKPSNM